MTRQLRTCIGHVARAAAAVLTVAGHAGPPALSAAIGAIAGDTDT